MHLMVALYGLRDGTPTRLAAFPARPGGCLRETGSAPIPGERLWPMCNGPDPAPRPPLGRSRSGALRLARAPPEPAPPGPDPRNLPPAPANLVGREGRDRPHPCRRRPPTATGGSVITIEAISGMAGRRQRARSPYNRRPPASATVFPRRPDLRRSAHPLGLPSGPMTAEAGLALLYYRTFGVPPTAVPARTPGTHRPVAKPFLDGKRRGHRP